MKTLKFLKNQTCGSVSQLSLMVLLLLSVSSFKANAQWAPGATKSNAIGAGFMYPYAGAYFTDVKNNGNPGYYNMYGQPSPDVWYKFSVSLTAEVTISLCGSNFDTHLTIYDSFGNVVDSNDDNGPECSGVQSSIKRSFTSGEYYILAEGYGSAKGTLNVTVSTPQIPYPFAGEESSELLNADPVPFFGTYQKSVNDGDFKFEYAKWEL